MIDENDDVDEPAGHLPSPDEIRKACQLIQSGWSEDERLRRQRYRAETFIVCDSVRQAALSALDEKLRRQRGRMAG